jgi:hypothetical protein
MNPLLSNLISTLLEVSSDELPPTEHQEAVKLFAEEYLQCLESGQAAQLSEIDAYFDRYPLVALEVIDEAFVVYKNRSNLWGNTAAQARDRVCIVIGLAFNKFARLVDHQRGGCHRASTTPTLKGGERRRPAPAAPEGTSYLPLIFALKDLRIRYFRGQLESPEEFSRSTSLMRGEVELTTGSEAQKTAWRQITPDGPLEEDPMAVLLLKDLGQWPQDAFIAMRGILAFGPGNDVLARQCALHALKLNPDCRLALQLLALLSQKQDVSIPFKNLRTEIQDVAEKMSATTPKAKTAEKRPWWRVWR